MWPLGWSAHPIVGDEDGLPYRIVYSVAVTGERVLAGTAYGLGIFEDGAWRALRMGTSGLSDDWVNAVAFRSDASPVLGLRCWGRCTWPRGNRPVGGLDKVWVNPSGIFPVAEEQGLFVATLGDNLWFGPTGVRRIALSAQRGSSQDVTSVQRFEGALWVGTGMASRAGLLMRPLSLGMLGSRGECAPKPSALEAHPLCAPLGLRPPPEGGGSPALPGRTNHLRCGVLVPLRWAEGPEVLLTRRAPTLKYGGEWCFRGGDGVVMQISTRQRAVKVTRSWASVVQRLGRLSSMPIGTSDYRLEPFVVAVDQREFSLTPQGGRGRGLALARGSSVGSSQVCPFSGRAGRNARPSSLCGAGTSLVRRPTP